ncbi:class A sortase SrtA [Staphylococcus sp. SQ8-PEA]|uniref:Class A sortase SrtA n=1 Tax=Staphylococcus marylandisciuri TaxID=2981529 RepID=A0ABT2QMY4_9STAP|nr:class A sortase SrtA [Staphylococcus marylandisciuri]MCU5745341.1 class A sortase SrtA [Staphylococcus marylandisciuri]
MNKWVNRLLTIIGVVLILWAIYIFMKPHIDNYFTKKDNEDKIEHYDKERASDSSRNSQKVPQIPKDPSKMAGYISVPDAEIKTPVYPGPATPQQLNRGVSFAEKDESMSDQNVSIAGHTYTDRPHYQFTNLPAAHKGSKVYLTIDGHKRTYKITKIYDVNPNNVEVLNEHKSATQQLTLITCDKYNSQTGEWEKRKIFVAKAV